MKGHAVGRTTVSEAETPAASLPLSLRSEAKWRWQKPFRLSQRKNSAMKAYVEVVTAAVVAVPAIRAMSHATTAAAVQ